ncbi:MAG: ABC transporter ATP-binding protein [Eggerthellaceae bacterium]|nr:ABC transporter ATP-binding protein [Eggerthellaceae bacterium]
MASKVFTVQGLSFGFAGAPLLFDGLDLSLNEGVVTTIIGANGCGKSTLLNLLTKNLRPSKGTIHLRNGALADLRAEDLAKLVAVVHQGNTAPFDMTVGRLVSMGRFPHRSGIGRLGRAGSEEDEAAVRSALEATGLSGFEQRTLSSLSGGQKQRAWVAMALAQGTKVLLLDEPTTFLDVRYQLELLRLVRLLNKERGLTVVMVLHDINQAIHYSDEVVALAHGGVAAQGDPAQIVDEELLEQVYGVGLEVVSVNGKPFVLNV